MELININIKQTKLFKDEMVDVIGEITSMSRARTCELPCVLCLRGNKTYGIYTGKHLYKCIPDNKQYPPFLVPYEIKHIGFSKILTNKYVLLRFSNWDNTHPYGVLTNVIGDVDLLDAYYEYQLCCQGLNDSIQPFNKIVSNKTLSNNLTNITKITNRNTIITIDPQGTRDFDDALSAHFSPDNSCIHVSVYIANVPACLDKHQLWGCVQWVSSVYLPNKVRPMLPTKLSEGECSLIAGMPRNVLIMDVILNASDLVVIDTTFRTDCIIVSHNYVYDSPSLLEDKEYQFLLDITKQMNGRQCVNNSHELVAFWMTQMNQSVANMLYSHKVGIFRRSTLTDNDVLPTSIKSWKNSTCDYIAFTEGDSLQHETMGLSKYVHITSPIRRIVDLVNMTLLLQRLQVVALSEYATKFCSDWVSRVAYINDRMKATRRVQTQCALLALWGSSSPNLLECDGYLFDEVIGLEGARIFSVYLKSLNLIYKIKMPQIDTQPVKAGDTRRMRIYLFCDEDSLKKKIRLHML